MVISTNVDPSTGTDAGGMHEIYQATVSLKDDVTTIEWQPLTNGTPKGLRNIRPMVLHKDGYRVILWQRGRFKTYRNYMLDTVGVIVSTDK